MTRSAKFIRPRKNRSFGTALILLIMLTVILLLATSLEKSGLPAGLSSLINADFENFSSLKQFDEERAKEVREQLAGFWTYAEGNPEKSPVAKREYLELNANGMVWIVKDWTVNAPGGDRHTVTHVVNGYFAPYSHNNDNSAYYCETRTIRQIFLYNGDTCYGGSQIDEMWLLSKTGDGDRLTLDQREYQRYTGDLKDFFPDNSLLDKVDAVSLNACPAAANLPFFAKKALARSLDAVPFFMRTPMTDSLIRAYYKPMVFDELARKYDPRAVPGEMQMQLTISPEGVVSDLKYKSGKLATKRFDDLAVMDVKSWLFAPVGDSEEAQKIEMIIKVK